MLSDPICALATPLGRSAIAVVRLSGRGVIDLARRLIGPAGAERELDPRRATLVTLRDHRGEPIDQALLTVFPGPDSYTGDDLVEISCHGGLAAPAAILARLEALGARPAAPGEFTRRAVENGKLDLLQAEAVSDIIDATTRAQASQGLRQLDGGLSKRIIELRDELLQALALYSYDIDFPDEDDGPIDRSRIEQALDRVATRLARLLATAPLGERLRAGAVVVVAGRPNVGKSSLFNGLLGATRALVTEVPGTTRDAIEAATEIGGWPVRLVDTAGVRATDDRVERLGIEVSWKYLDRADLVLLCVDDDRPLDVEELAIAGRRPTVVVRTKIDLTVGTRAGPATVRVSTMTGQGLDDLQQVLAERLFSSHSGFGDVEPLLARERHRTAVSRAADEIRMAKSQLVAGGEPVLAAHHIKMAATALEELIGAVGVEDVLSKVFSQFCVGK